MAYTMGSLFDGIGGFPLAGQRHGIEALWASEIESFPIQVTKLRFPDMKHYGDITMLDGSQLPPVDVITGGSPCQDLSVAGKRAGLEGERSGLFMEQIRIVKEMRKNGKPQDICSGRMSPEPSAATTGKTSVQSSKRQQGSQMKPLLYLHLQKENGQQQDVSWETAGALPGESWTPNTGESPNAAVESRLSQILEANPHQKYFLSEKACQGILRRAENRGKALPPQLKEALEIQAYPTLW